MYINKYKMSILRHLSDIGQAAWPLHCYFAMYTMCWCVFVVTNHDKQPDWVGCSFCSVTLNCPTHWILIGPKSHSTLNMFLLNVIVTFRHCQFRCGQIACRWNDVCFRFTIITESKLELVFSVQDLIWCAVLFSSRHEFECNCQVNEIEVKLPCSSNVSRVQRLKFKGHATKFVEHVMGVHVQTLKVKVK